MLHYLIVDIFFSFIGRMYLYLRYRDSEKVNKVKEERYAGHFRYVGRIVILNIVAVLFGLILISGLLATIIGIFRNGISAP